MMLFCKRCGNEWCYNGDNAYQCNCSHCGTTVQIRLGHERYQEKHAVDAE